MFIQVSYRNGNKSATYIGKILEAPNPESKRVWGERVGMFVFHKGNQYLHLDECFKVQEYIDGELQPIEYDPKPKDINIAHIVGTSPMF